jgi:hypothetical protein
MRRLGDAAIFPGSPTRLHDSLLSLAHGQANEGMREAVTQLFSGRTKAD